MKVALREDGRLAVEQNSPADRTYYGWVMLPIAMAALIATSPGQTFGVSIFNDPMRQSLGLSHGQLAAAYMLGTLLAAAPIAYIGALMDRFGLRSMMTLAVFLFGLACLVTSQASGWFSLFFSFWMLRLLGPGAMSFLSSNTLAFWYDRRLGTMEGIRNLGMAAAMAPIPALNLWLIGRLGWRGAYAALGFAVWAIMLPIVLIWFRNRPEDIGQTIDGGPVDAEPGDLEASHADVDVSSSLAPPISQQDFTLGESLRSRSFWIVTGGTSAYGLIHTAVFFSIVPILLDRGLGEAQAARMLTVFAVSLAAMQLIGGTLADRFKAHFLMPVALGGLTAGVLLLTWANSTWTANIAGVVLGLSQGLFFGTSNPLWARYFGRMHLGKIRGALVALNVASSSAGPLVFGLARDALGSYDLVLCAFAILPVPLVVLSFLATPPVKRDDRAICLS